jgi:hypothetical protein
MRLTMPVLRPAGLFALSALLLTGCGSSDGGDPDGGEPLVVTILEHPDTVIARTMIQLSVEVTDADGDPVSDDGVTWESADTTILRATGGGSMQGKAPGTVTVRARLGTVVDSTTLQVLPAVATVTVAPADTILPPNGSFQFVATTYDSTGAVLTGRPVTWLVAQPRSAKVSASGLVTMNALDSVFVQARSEGRSGGNWVVSADSFSTVRVIWNGVCVVTTGGTTLCNGETGTGTGSACDVALTYPDCYALMTMPHPIDTLDPDSHGRDLVCARNNGTPVCWGSGSMADLPNSAGGPKVAPHQLVGLPSVDELATSLFHGCALSGADVWCWGDGLYEKLGRPNCDSTVCAPAIVAGLSATHIAIRETLSCATTGSGTVACWGVIGVDTASGAHITSATPVTMDSVTGATAIATTTGSTCALGTGGAVWCWGANNSRQLGDGTEIGRFSPRKVVGLPALTTLIGASRGFCGLDASGGAWCWGEAGSTSWDGPLTNTTTCGGPTTLCRVGPTHLAPALSFTALSSSSHFVTCGLATDGIVYCWGVGAMTGGPWGDTPTRLPGQRE